MKNISVILGRNEHDLEALFQRASRFYANSRIMITGADGSLGHALRKFIKDYNVDCKVYNFDINFDTKYDNQYLGDVTDIDSLSSAVSVASPDYVFHFAADKHAPHGEDNPESTISINLVGTDNLLNCIDHLKTKIILSSTCKSCNPETVYGSTKLISERLVLNAGHVVARYYNVVESSGNVFEIWNSESDPSKHVVTECSRFFISMNEALALTLFTGTQAFGRYTVNPGTIRDMTQVHKDIYGVEGIAVPMRRGDRKVELRLSTSEYIAEKSGVFERVESYHD